MHNRKYRIPSTSVLTAFECSARHLNFSRAADELHTSQSAISRHITNLEARLGVTLFLRGKKKHQLTEQGELLYRAVVSGLDNIQSSLNSITGWSSNNDITVSCTHEISHLYLMPRFDALQAAVGDDVQIRIVTNEYAENNTSLDPRIDLAFRYKSPETGNEPSSVVLNEAICPVCSPEFLQKHRALLSGPPAKWSELAFLQLTRLNQGWATWEDWFSRAGTPATPLNYVRYDNYVYLLEAAAVGRGLALGWRGLIERYIEAGTLTLIGDDFMQTDNALHAFLTASGQTKPTAKKCLGYLSNELLPET